LPALKEAKRHSGGDAVLQRGESGAKSRRILVVDDSLDTAIGMARLLRIDGHEVEIAHDGHTAIEAALSFGPEVLLLDLGLPGLSDYEIADRLRNEDACRNAVFIAISGYAQEQDRGRSQAAGFDHHLAKPVDFTSLRALISTPTR
jgi:CheY-like chemotaxis protein